MAENRISGLQRDYSEIRQELIKIQRQYYPDLGDVTSDQSVGSFFIDLAQDTGSALNTYIDRAFNETNIDTAQTRRALFSIARSKGLRIGGQKQSLVECAITVRQPLARNEPKADERYLPLLKKGSMAGGQGNSFELLEDCQFYEQFNNYGVSNRNFRETRDSNGAINGYEITKDVLMSGSETQIIKKSLSDYDIMPFMEYTIEDTNVLEVESIIFKEGTDFSYEPPTSEYEIPMEYLKDGDNPQIWRFFEVDSLLEDKLFLPIYNSSVKSGQRNITITRVGTSVNGTINTKDLGVGNGYLLSNIGANGSDNPTINYQGETYSAQTNNLFFANDYGQAETTTYTIINAFYQVPGSTPQVWLPNAQLLEMNNQGISVMKGEWKPVRQKFITEYTDNGFFKIIFGQGSDYGNFDNQSTVGQSMISQTINNMNMGVLPKPGWTMWLKYRTGGGASSNVATGVIKQITYKDITILGDGTNSSEDAKKKNDVERSLIITNTYPSVSGKDAPSNNEIRNMIKYNSLQQERCVSVKDYEDRIGKMPPIFGCPFRYSVGERNNMILISVLSINNLGQLTSSINSTLLENMSNYLSEYRTQGGAYVVIKPAKIINIQVECDFVCNKQYTTNEVVQNIVNVIKSFFDIQNRGLNENLYVSMLNHEIGNVGGVVGIVETRVYNVFSGSYSNARIQQRIISGYFDDNGTWQPQNDGNNRVQVDLKDSQGVLFGSSNTMFEIKTLLQDVRVRATKM